MGQVTVRPLETGQLMKLIYLEVALVFWPVNLRSTVRIIT